MLKLFLLLLLLSHITSKPLTFILSFDNALHYIKRNDITVVKIDKEKDSNKFYWDTFDCEERDLLTIEVGNGQKNLGVLGTINFNTLTFFIGYSSKSFLFAKKPLKSYDCDGEQYIGYDNSGKDGFVYFTVPKTFVIDYTNTVKSEGYIFDFSDVFYDTSEITFVKLQTQGILSSSSCSKVFSLNQPYNADCYKFTYKPNTVSIIDTAYYTLYNGKRESILFLVIHQGYRSQYVEDKDGPMLEESPCRESFYPKKDNKQICLNDTLKDENYYFVEDEYVYAKCDISCKTCDKIPTNCTECSYGYQMNP